MSMSSADALPHKITSAMGNRLATAYFLNAIGRPPMAAQGRAADPVACGDGGFTGSVTPGP
jgi:hypothetical protein